MRDYGQWTHGAACRDMDPDMFSRPKDGEQTQHAKRTCQISCSVKKECLAHAVIYKETGVWGGYSESERRYIRSGIRRRLMAIAIVENRIDPRLLTDPKGIEMYKELLKELSEQGFIPHKLVSNTGSYDGPMAA